MPSLKSSFSFLFICFIFNIGKSQSNGKIQIDNIIFEQFLKDSKKDKKIDNYCEQKVLDEITALEINLESCDINGDTYLKISFELNLEHDVPKKYYLFKKTLFEKKTIKSRDCYFDKFFVQVDYESFLNFNWDFTSSMKNLVYFGFFNRSDISSFPAFNKNPINLSNLNNLGMIRIKDKVLIGMPSTINGGVNILVGHNNALKYIEAPYGLFSQLINSSELSDLEHVTICSQIDTIVNIKRLNSIKILNIPYSVTNEEYKIRSMVIGGIHSILNFTRSIDRLSIGSNKKLEDQFEITFNDSIKIKNLEFYYLHDDDNKTTLNLKLDVSKHAEIIEIAGLHKPFYSGSKLLNGVHVPNLVVPVKLILYQTRNQSFYYKNNPELTNPPKVYDNDPSIPQYTWIEFHNVKTKAEIEADSIAKIQLDEQIKIQKEIKQKEEEFSGLRAFSPSDSPSTEKVKGSIKSTETVGVVTIGSQVWTSKNLNVSTYRNGDVIPQVQDQEAWATLTTGAWCYYNNDPANGTKYGKLYNWYAVNDARGLAPQGYHIPNDAEWHILLNYLGGHDVAGTKMKSSSGWNSFNTGGSKTCPNCEDLKDEYRRKVACHTCKDTRKVPSPIVTHSGNGTNSSGFSGLPGGCIGHSIYSYSLNYGKLGELGCWWRSATNIHDDFWYEFMHSKGGYVEQGSSRNAGFSVRCLRD